VDVLKQSVLYPLDKKERAKAMVFKDASGQPHNMLPRTDLEAFKQLKWLVDSEGKNLAGPDSLGMLAAGAPFAWALGALLWMLPGRWLARRIAVT